MTRHDKLTRLVAVFDQFYAALTSSNEVRAKRLVEAWATARPSYIDPKAGPRSAYATGMEQALREMPMLLSSLGADDRKVAARALSAAIGAHYPDFAAKDAQRLEKIKARGRVLGESEYSLVRHQIDVLEADPSRTGELQAYYALVDGYEASH